MARPKRNLSEPRPIKKPVSPQARKSSLRKLSHDNSSEKSPSTSPITEALEDAGSATEASPPPPSSQPPCKLARNDDGEHKKDTEIPEVAAVQDSSQPAAPRAPTPQQSTATHGAPAATSPATSPSTPPSSGACPLLKLPNELLLTIGHLLPEPALARLLLTCRHLHVLLTHILYRLGLHIEFLDQRTVLHLAAERGFYLTTLHLLSAGASPNSVSSPRNSHPLHSDGLTPLHVASQLNRVRIARVLLSYGAKTRVWDAAGNTPLHTAVENGNTAIVRLLINAKAKVTARRADGMRPLHVAAMMGHKRCVRLLLDANADVEAKDDTGGTALGLAAGVGEEGCVRILLRNGAKLDVADSQGWTPVFWAAWVGNVPVLAELVKAGAGLDGKDKEGKGVLKVAEDREKVDVVKWLKKRMGKEESEGKSIEEGAAQVEEADKVSVAEQE